MKTRLAILLIAVPLVAWSLFGFLGDRVSARLSSRFGAAILSHGDGKFTNVQVFIKGRIKEGAVLVSAACLLILLQRTLATCVFARFKAPVRWIIQAWSAFISLNIFAAIAGGTVLFWCLLFTGKDHTHNYTQWCIKQGLMKEVDAPSQAVLLGASQTRTQIDTKVLNERMGQRLWTTELHFPGSDPYEMTLCLERLPNVRVDYVITYVSEVVFFSGSDHERFMFFLGWRDLARYWTLGPGSPGFNPYLICGLLGDTFPLYRQWEPITARLRGWEAATEQQRQRDARLETNLVRRAQIYARDVNALPVSLSDFNKKEFEVFAEMCRERHSRLVICCGQMNPILGRELSPTMRPDMMNFLHELASKDSNIVILDESQFPPQGESDYVDLNHVNKDARARYSQRMAEALDKLSQTNPPPVAPLLETVR